MQLPEAEKRGAESQAGAPALAGSRFPQSTFEAAESIVESRNEMYRFGSESSRPKVVGRYEGGREPIAFRDRTGKSAALVCSPVEAGRIAGCPLMPVHSLGEMRHALECPDVKALPERVLAVW
jgi:hypothetical protein